MTNSVANAEVRAWTATLGGSKVQNRWIQASWEPIVWRTKWHATGNADNTIVLSESTLTGYDSWRDGFLDGAEVRIYRVRNGQLVNVRNDTILNYRCSGWIGVQNWDETKVVDPNALEYQFKFEDWYRKGVTGYIRVRAIDAAGQTSPGLAYTTVVSPSQNATSSGTRTLIAKPSGGTDTVPGAPSDPTNLACTVDPTARFIRVTWTAAPEADVAGYIVQRSDYDPATHRGYGVDLAGTGAPIKTGDMIYVSHQTYTFNKSETVSNRLFSASQGSRPDMTPFEAGLDPARDWWLAPHPAPVPEELQVTGGETCLKVIMNDTGTYSIDKYIYGSTQQNWYRVLDPAKTYRVEFWARHDGMANPRVEFDVNSFYGASIPSTFFNIDGTWQKYTTTFQPPNLYNSGTQTGQFRLVFAGSGTLYLDEWRVFEDPATGGSFGDMLKYVLDDVRTSGMRLFRTHSTIKSGWSYTMRMLTNADGIYGYSGNNGATRDSLPQMFKGMLDAGASPWLQVEMCMSEAEWDAFIQYIVGDYNPAVDTPESKPYAWKAYQHRLRYVAQGATNIDPAIPWVDHFPEIYFEIANETWNGLFAPWVFMGYSLTDEVTGQTYASGEIYGLFMEYVLARFRATSEWAVRAQEMEDKFTFILGGWGTQAGSDTGYGNQAGKISTSSDYVTYADYNGGWDAGEAPAEATDDGFSKALTIVGRRTRRASATESRNSLRDRGIADFLIGTYEAGPGYNLNGLNGVTMTAAQMESENKVMKSLAAGTATLDAFLARAYTDYDVQNFFTLGVSRDTWNSHAPWNSGGQSYPSWRALTMFNRWATGDMLVTRTISAPTWDLPTGWDSTYDAKDMADVYATRQGNRYSVFVVSRKLDDYPLPGDDGFTPVTVRLPFSNPASITLHKLQSANGDPRANNLDSDEVTIVTENIPIAEFDRTWQLTPARGADARGLPPGHTFLYVFEGVSADPVPLRPAVSVNPLRGQTLVNVGQGSGKATFEVVFSEPVSGFDPADLTLAESTCDIASINLEIKELPPYNKTVYNVIANNLSDTGILALSVLANGVTGDLSGLPNDPSPATNNGVLLYVDSLGPAAGSITLTAIADTWTNYEDFRGGNPLPSQSNYGTSTVMETGSITGRSSWMKFNLLPLKNRQITNAVLRLYSNRVLNGASSVGKVMKIEDDSWTEGGLKAVNEPTVKTQVGTLAPGLPVGYPNAWAQTDLTNAVSTEVAGDRVLSLQLYDCGWWQFRTKEFEDGTKAAQLVVTYAAVPAYTTWAGQITDPGLRAEGADPDGDGLANLLEYAFDRSPVAHDSLTAWPLAAMADSRLAISFLRNPDKTDLIYRVEASTNLIEWTETLYDSSQPSGLYLYNNYGNRMQVSDSVPIDDLHAQRFLRVRVELVE